MLSMVVVLPEPPLLVPELAGAAAVESTDVRAACRDAATRLAAASSNWIAVGADRGGRRTVDPDTRGTFAGFGVDVVVGLDPDTTAPVDRDLPLPLLIAGWVAAERARVRGELVAPDLPSADCTALGARLAVGAEPVGLLVLGDGAATHTEKAPGHLDARAKRFDDTVARALRAADPAALAGLDPELAAQLWVAGRAPWQVLAGAATGTAWTGELLYSAAPFGVAYHVAVWTRR